MDTRGILDNLLRSGQDMLQKQTGGKSAAGAGRAGPLGDMLSGAGKGALAAGTLGLLLGSKKARKMGGSALKYGSLAALGMVAYKAFSNWQQQQGGTAASRIQPQTADRLPAPEAEEHSRAVLRALIGAAKADGHIDDRERGLIHDEVARLTGDQELQGWFDQELHKPLDPAEIAKSAATREIAAEMYLASLLVIDEQNYMERAYLDELARQMKLDPALRAELERQAMDAAA